MTIAPIINGGFLKMGCSCSPCGACPCCVEGTFFALAATCFFAGFSTAGSPGVLSITVSPGVLSITGSRGVPSIDDRSEEHTSELQSRGHLVCRLLLEKKNQ